MISLVFSFGLHSVFPIKATKLEWIQIPPLIPSLSSPKHFHCKLLSWETTVFFFFFFHRCASMSAWRELFIKAHSIWFAQGLGGQLPCFIEAKYKIDSSICVTRVNCAYQVCGWFPALCWAPNAISLLSDHCFLCQGLRPGCVDDICGSVTVKAALFWFEGKALAEAGCMRSSAWQCCISSAAPSLVCTSLSSHGPLNRKHEASEVRRTKLKANNGCLWMQLAF